MRLSAKVNCNLRVKKGRIFRSKIALNEKLLESALLNTV